MIEFFGGGYFLDVLALHLTFAYLAVTILSIYLFASKKNTLQKLVALYFAFTLFNNPAFQIAGASLGDMCGVLGVSYFLLRVIGYGEYRRMLVTHRLTFLLLLAVALIVVHQVFINAIYSVLNENGAFAVRLAVTFKIVVLAVMIWIFSQEFRDTSSVHWMMDWIVSFAVVGVVAYFIQIAIIFTGKLPYGTFFDAGHVGVPVFGGVSIERGHFGKFLTPLFPFFLLMYLKHGRKRSWIAFLIVTIINVSASSLVYFLAYVLLTAFFFRDQLRRPKVLAWVTAGVVSVFALGIALSDVVVGVSLKIFYMVFKGEAEGGRSVSNFLDYLHRYPWGMSYGGSTLRHIKDLNEMNSGIMAFVTQLSVLAPILLVGYILLLVSCYRRSKYIDDIVTRRVMVVGCLMTLLIYSSDPLWFVPTIWLPIVICQTMCLKGSECPTCEAALMPKRRSRFIRFLVIATQPEEASATRNS
jgi:hypothetical protein